MDDEFDEEVGTLLGIPKTKKNKENIPQSPPPKTNEKKAETIKGFNKNETISINNKGNISKTPLVNAAVLKEFTKFLQEKAKYYEEISFDTIIRKIPKTWNFTSEAILIDIIEKLLEHGFIGGKMTAHSFKFQNIDKMKEK